MTAKEFQYELINLQENLMGFAHSLTADADMAKDLVQETFLKALKYCDKFVHGSSLKAWTYTILKNTFINNYRQIVCHHTYHKQTKKGFHMGYPHASYVEDASSACTSKELEKTIEELDNHFKLPFKMHHEGFKYKEIAEILDLKLGTVKSRIYFARKKLMQQLDR
jgi:RNA polymerase sigma factor (sigma-70 family)